jgi:hypothetical protein
MLFLMSLEKKIAFLMNMKRLPLGFFVFALTDIMASLTKINFFFIFFFKKRVNRKITVRMYSNF